MFKWIGRIGWVAVGILLIANLVTSFL